MFESTPVATEMHFSLLSKIVKETTAKHGQEEEEPINQPVSDDLEKCSVIELKDKLRAMNLPVSGRKAELIQRIREAK